VCFELGRFPYELPDGLPDEQVDLMLAYLAVRAEQERATSSERHIERARGAEADMQAAEAAAWKTTRKAVLGG